ncbi:MAG: hypothetical protein WCX78_04525 [Patescibacteria group bacterium]|jgi:hypothetical protein
MNHKTKDPYIKALEMLRSEVSRDSDLNIYVHLIALLGSVLDEEHIPGYSDLDILLLTDCDKSGNIPFIVITKLKTIAEKTNKEFRIQISLLPHTIDDFKNYVCFEYLTHYSWGKVVYGDQILLSSFIKKVIEDRKIDEEIRQRYCVYHLRHIRFNLIRKYISLNKYQDIDWEKKFGKTLIDGMLEASEWVLNFFDIWPKSKAPLCNMMTEQFSDEFDTEIIHKALKARLNYSTLSSEDIRDFLPGGIAYICNLCEFILKKYNSPTPEELINPKK